MGKAHISILVLSIALVGSNAWWLYQAYDVAVTGEYQAVTLRDNHEALAQALAVMPVVARPEATREQVIRAAQAATHLRDTFEKDGFTWIGRLGFKFDDSGHLTEVAPSWSPF
jgi:hypothetical protein